MLLKIIKGTHYLNLKLAQRQLYLVVSPADLAAINCEAVTGKICKTWPSPLCRANVEFYRFYLINHHTHPNKLHIFVNPTLHAIVYSLWAGVIVLTQVLDGVSGEKGVSHGQLEIFSIFHFLSKLWYSLTPLASLNKIAECAGSTDTSTALVGQYCHDQHRYECPAVNRSGQMGEWRLESIRLNRLTERQKQYLISLLLTTLPMSILLKTALYELGNSETKWDIPGESLLDSNSTMKIPGRPPSSW